MRNLKAFFALFLAVVIFVLAGCSVTHTTPIAADEVAGPEVQGYGVKPSAFEYAGYKMVPWDLGDKVQPFDIPEYMQRANDNNDNAFSKAVRSCSAAGFPYIMIIDTYKCVGDNSIYDKSGMTYIYAFKSIPTFTMVEVGTGTFIYKSSPIIQTYRKYHVKGNELCSSNNYASYGYFEDGYSNLGNYDCEATTESPRFLCIAENFSGARFQNSDTVSINYYKNNSRAINFFSNFDPQIEGIDFDGGQAVKDSIFNGQHSGSVVATTDLSGSIDTATTKSFSVSVKNGRSDSIQYALYISTSATTSSSDIPTTYQGYKWSYQTYQSCKVYRGNIAQSVVDSTTNFLDSWGESFPLSRATKTPLYMLLKKVGDSQLLGVYTDGYLSCPYHFVSSGNTDNLSFDISELPLSKGQPYFLTVVYRDTTVQEVAAHHRATYAYTYYDDVSQMNNYDIALCSSFSLTESVYVAPKTDDQGRQLDSDGNIKKDSNGNPISSSKNYSSDVINLKNGNASSDAFAQGGSATAQGGSAEVVNNNSPVFNNNPSITINGGGGSGSGSGSGSDGDGSSGSGSGSGFSGFGDLKGFSNALDSSKNFLSVLQSYEGLIPSSCMVLLGAGVVAIIICRFIGR